MLRTPLCDLLGIKYPIIQGGMAWLGTAELVSAVSNAGGLGIIGAGNHPPDWVREQIHVTRQLTDKPFGINVVLLSPHAEGVIKVVLEEKVGIVAFGAGNPGVHIPEFKKYGAITMPVVSSVILARRLERSGADIIVAEGMESGGHVGETATTVLVPQVVEAVNIPVVAAGGFCDGKGLVMALAMGAQGMQMGTRFIASEECIAHPKFKKKITEVKDRCTMVTGETLKHPLRCLENKLTRQFHQMEMSGTPKEELEKLGVGKMFLGVIQGDLENGSLMCGQIAGMIKDIKPVKQIIEDIMVQAEAEIKRLAAMPNGEKP
ncbi:MAG: nitronate monooxygenase [Dehalococcoidia bacterium]|nr:nitronate monooxygenase [Dehalococcoidia bacterium]